MEEDNKKLGLPDALKIAQSLKRVLYSEKTQWISITFNTNHLSSKRDHINNILLLKGRPCIVCGKNNHTSKKCFYKDYQCDRCQQKGHLKYVCPRSSAKNRTSGNRNRTQDGEEGESEALNNEQQQVYTIVGCKMQN
jgi:hypothetical protein